MSDNLVITLDRTAITAASTEHLREQLASALTMTARHLQHLAAIWQELERRGEDLSALRRGIAQYLPLIAAGRLEAEAVVRYAGQAILLRALSELPVAQQRALLEDGAVPLARLDAEGNSQQESVPLDRLSVAQIRLAFAGNSLRPVQDQVRMLLPERRQAPSGRSMSVTLHLTRDERLALAEHARRGGGRHLHVFVRERLRELGLLTIPGDTP